jgi:predicted nuclease of predicted toxin-antitoxin system
MRFLADESCDFAAVRALRAAGHDVIAVAEIARGATDSEVIAVAVQDRRILLTEDKDFGRLVHAAAKTMSGVLLIRFPAPARSELARIIVDLVRERGTDLVDAFTVLQPARVRISRNPSPPVR